jgi:hypothetical protein
LGVPAYWRCGVVLCVVWWTLRVVGFGRTLTTVRSIAERRPMMPAGTVDVHRIAGRVAAVAAFFPGRVLCLEQSLALYWLLRLRGVAAKLRFGVHPAPFTAHAWIEYEGVPVNEDDDRIRELLPLRIEGMEGM